MNNLIQFLSQPWPWYVAGPVIALVMFLLMWFGNTFGISSNLRTMCSIFGAGKSCEFFDFDWKAQTWNLVFVAGLILGGFLAHTYLMPANDVHISEATISELSAMGVENPGQHFLPVEIFNWESLLSLKGFIFIIIGGFLIGFGTRYAGGCTSGHAITGLSELQLPSLIAVIGFFIGGLAMTYFILPSLLAL